jgi:hypothetical protein
MTQIRGWVIRFVAIVLVGMAAFYATSVLLAALIPANVCQ